MSLFFFYINCFNLVKLGKVLQHSGCHFSSMDGSYLVITGLQFYFRQHQTLVKQGACTASLASIRVLACTRK